MQTSSRILLPPHADRSGVRSPLYHSPYAAHSIRRAVSKQLLVLDGEKALHRAEAKDGRVGATPAEQSPKQLLVLDGEKALRRAEAKDVRLGTKAALKSELAVKAPVFCTSATARVGAQEGGPVLDLGREGGRGP